ncbi:MAG: hypothetical protein AABP62_14135 [Planctomycetota bacterium]
MNKNLVIALVVSTAMIGTSWLFAQEPAPSRPNPNPGAGGGPGGFPTFVGPDRTVTLLKLPEVQAELKLEEDKSKKLDAISEEITRERERLNAEYNARLNVLNKKAEGDALGLLSDAQRRRTEQLRFQQQDLRFLSSNWLAASLGFSQEQRAEIRKITTERDPRFGNGRDGDRNTNPPNPNIPAPERVRETAEEANKRFAETREKVLAVLTPEQKAKWSEMTGEPFKFPTPQWSTTRGTNTRPSEPAKPDAEKKDQ